jgi:isoquinoline 1-oxidoreductase beta subunit
MARAQPLHAPREPSRRRFVLGAAALGGALVVGYRLRTLSGAKSPLPAPMPNPFESYVQIAPSGKVTILSSQFESGQGIYFGIATLVQEELEATWDDIEVIGAYGNSRLYINKVLGMQATGGSTGTFVSFDRYRIAGATARRMLVEAAAALWSVEPGQIRTLNGVLHHDASGRHAGYGELVELAARREVPRDVPLKPPEQWIYIGKENLRRYDSRAKTNGSQVYTIDLQLPGMLTAVMIHPPRFGATVRGFDAAKAKALKGVVDVVQTPRGIAVVADHMWSALKGRELVSVEWNEEGAERRGTEILFAQYRMLADRGEGAVALNTGDSDAAFKTAAKVIEATYEFPYLAHAAMEPLNAAVRMNADGTLEVWGGHQYQDTYQALAAKLAGIAPEKVILRTLRTGGSFGRRAVFDADVISEALLTAKAMGYKAPVKVQWTREDDMRAGQYRPAFLHRLKAGIDDQGRLLAWRDTIVGQSLLKGTPLEVLVKNDVDPNSVEGSATMPYEVPNARVTVSSPLVGVPVTFLRAVGMNHAGFAIEAFIDEAAALAGRDPLAFRLSHLANHPRPAGVLQLAALKAGWGTPLPAGRARGIAYAETFGTHVAQVAEVSFDKGNLKVHRVVCAIDCGIVVNPDQVRAQMEGGIGFGLGLVLKAQITLDEGKVVQGNFADYEIPRIYEMPSVEVHIVESTEPPSGSGEPGVPPTGPAVANALYALTKKRIRQLPFSRPENDADASALHILWPNASAFLT